MKNKSKFSGADPFGDIAFGKKQLGQWAPFVLGGERKALVLSDLHIPYHDRAALVAALEYGKAAKVDTVVLNGDVADFFSISRWEKDPRHRNFAKELEAVKSFLKTLRREFNRCDIVFKEGNHEARLCQYMRTKAPELLGIEALDLQSLIGLTECGIKFVADMRPIQLGHLNILHGHEYKFSISNPVNPARGIFLRCKAYAMAGHFHQSSQHSERTVTQSTIATWSNGCLCDIHPEYLPLNNWVHGFAVVTAHSTGKFTVDHRTIKGGKVL